MGGDGAINIVFKDQLRAVPEDQRDAKRAELLSEYQRQFFSPYRAANLGYVDAVIEPSQTRKLLISAFDSLQNKRDKNPPKKHGNIPL